MGKRWVVKNSGSTKGTHIRREAKGDTDDANVIDIVPNGEVVVGDFMFIRRASREVGFVKLRHLELRCGKSWRVRNAEAAPSTLLRKSPSESADTGNSGGYVNEGEFVDGEYIYVCRKDEKVGGFVKKRHLKMTDRHKHVQVAAALTPVVPEGQRWVVMDVNHDGAWMRRAPKEDRDQRNIIRLIANGETVIGEYLCVREATAGRGFVKFRHLEQLGAKNWRVRNAAQAINTLLRKEPKDAFDSANTVGVLTEGATCEGEYVFVYYRDGKYSGFVKRRHLTALKPKATDRFTDGVRTVVAVPELPQ